MDIPVLEQCKCVFVVFTIHLASSISGNKLLVAGDECGGAEKLNKVQTDYAS